MSLMFLHIPAAKCFEFKGASHYNFAMGKFNLFAPLSKTPKIDRVLDPPKGISTNNMNFCHGINGAYYLLLVIFLFHI